LSGVARAGTICLRRQGDRHERDLLWVDGLQAARGIGPVDPVDPPELPREELSHAAAFLSEQGVQAEYTLAIGDPATEILELAESRKADLIVIGTREASLLERLLDPSVSGAVNRRAHCDVLVVH
jgi:nucleotide-binding universal stress UspA family protein